MKSLKMFYAASQAQDRPAREGKAGGGNPADRIKQLTEQLSLTDAQQTKVKAILTEQGAARKALAGDTALSDQDRRAKGMELMRSTNAKIRAVLTPEQQTKFDKLSAGGPGGGKGKGGGKKKKDE